MNLSILIERYNNGNFTPDDIDTHRRHQLPTTYDICLAIPMAKKCAIWMTFYEERHICAIILLDKYGAATDCRIVEHAECVGLSRLFYGTMIYGSIYDNAYIVMEDLVQYMGCSMQYQDFRDKLSLFRTVVDGIQFNHISLHLPVMWMKSDNIPPTISYRVHHYEWRKMSSKPSSIQKKTVERMSENESSRVNVKVPSNHRPNLIFEVGADIQNDIYHLYAYGKGCQSLPYDIACISTIKTSVMMNRLFRNIKENENLDVLEESDDESEFENQREDRFVNLQKRINMECEYNTKFRKWTPLWPVRDRNARVVHVSQLAKRRAVESF